MCAVVAFAPVAQASVLADMFGIRAEAGGETMSSTYSTQNSQTLALLDPNSVSPSFDKSDTKNTKKDESKTEETEVDPNSTVNISSDNALLPAATAATPDEDANYSDGEYNIDVYVVRKGDSVAAIADMFGITADTVYSANDLPKGSKVKEGDILIILPFSGVEYTVKKGDTLKGIANKFKVPSGDILGFNDINGSKITVGQKLMIPGGEIQTEVKKVAKKTTGKSSGGSIPLYVENTSTNTNGYFIKPIPCRLTQGRHDRYAVDMGCRTSGTPIHAAAEGEVIFAKVGWNGAFGNLVIIRHPNGTQTFYAHQSKIAVSKGDHVNQGDVIGYVGNTGRSTGPHLHFEVRGAKNPGFDNSWKPWSGY